MKCIQHYIKSFIMHTQLINGIHGTNIFVKQTNTSEKYEYFAIYSYLLLIISYVLPTYNSVNIYLLKNYSLTIS